MQTIRKIWDCIVYSVEMAGYARAHSELQRMGKREEAQRLLEIMRNHRNV